MKLVSGWKSPVETIVHILETDPTSLVYTDFYSVMFR